MSSDLEVLSRLAPLYDHRLLSKGLHHHVSDFRRRAVLLQGRCKAGDAVLHL